MYVITGWQVLSNLALLLLALLFSKKAFREPSVMKASSRFFAIISIFLIYLYAFHDLDYLGYKSMVDTHSIHFEEIYINIVDLVSENYFLFRLIVFGSAYVLMLLALKRMDVGFDLCFFFYAMTSVCVLSYGRFTLALSLSFLGYTFVIKPYKPKLLSIAMGIALIVVALEFHRSSLILVPLYIASLFIHQFNRRNITLFVLLVALVAIYYYLLGSELLLAITQADTLENYEASRSFGAGSGGNGIGITIHRILQYSKYYLTLILFVIVVAKNNFKDWPLPMKMLSAFYVLIMILAFLFSFDLDGTATGLLYYRTLYYSSIAMVVFLAYCYKMNIRRRFVRVIVYIGLLSQIYEISYHAYQAFLGQMTIG